MKSTFIRKQNCDQVKMYSKLLLVLALYFAVAESNDIHLGYTSARSKRIYSELKEAGPAIWKRSDEVEVNTTYNEVIDAVYVTDLREDHDGEAYIKSGGVGMQSVVIALKSPTIFRGYKFQIDVYASNQNERYFHKGGGYNGDTQYARKW
ncbi:unnamed protein product [Chrysodeixis includens]|uniref:Uncharacterized protein n=1 Tax=Chrysodeixis includens TaxID=689277 RepID=A0A9P0FUF9_CHRIL|nr:unnamed protein product [Chrysodeixis includens]